MNMPLSEIYLVVWSNGRKKKLFWSLMKACDFADEVFGDVFAAVPQETGDYKKVRQVKTDW